MISNSSSEDIGYITNSIISKYEDKTAKDLATLFDVNLSAKNGLQMLFLKMIDVSENPSLRLLQSLDDFKFKTVRLNRYGELKESMSLPAFKFCDIVEEEWETSKLRTFFFKTTFAFIVFRAISDDYYLQSSVIWKMPSEVLDGKVYEAWQNVVNSLRSGRVVKYVDKYGRYCSYFPPSSDNPYVHVRPHAKDRNDTYQLPITDRLTGLQEFPKHCFWLNRNYVYRIIKNSVEERK